jgi:4-diphosphocytidyl-2-C-methyl-D-erythritol kinase
MSSDTLNILCPAKINLALSVGAARAGDGMHPICSWMVLVGLCDVLTLTHAEDARSTFDIRWHEDAPLLQEVDWPLSSDLGFRAHGLMEEYVGRKLPVEVELRKNIPAGAGLGGGSGNAAGMLAGLNTLFALNLDDVQLGELGLRLGSDVYFMLKKQVGVNSAVVSGCGECLELMESGRVIYFVLILPPLSCSTPEVYGVFDRVAGGAAIDTKRVMGLVSDHPVLNDALFNDLTDAAFEVQPALLALRGQVQAAAGMRVHVSGSGSAMFVVVQSREEGEAVARRIKEQTGVASLFVETPTGVLGD